MLNSKEQLMSQARADGYKPEILEKVYRLLEVFQQIMLQNQFEQHRAPMMHAGGKMVWFYPSPFGAAWFIGS